MNGARAAHRSGAPQPHTWTARVLSRGEDQNTAYVRQHSFDIGRQASFHDKDGRPSAVEVVLGALGADLLAGFQRLASRRRVSIDSLEVSVTGRLNNPLLVLDVVGEQGNPGLEAVEGTLYVCAGADEPLLEEIWRAALAASPLVTTLERCVELSLRMSVVP